MFVCSRPFPIPGDSWSVPVAGAVIFSVLVGILPIAKGGQTILGVAPQDYALCPSPSCSELGTDTEEERPNLKRSDAFCSDTSDKDSDSDDEFQLRFGGRSVRQRVEVIDSISPWGPSSDAFVKVPGPPCNIPCPQRRQWRLRDEE